MNFFLFFCIFSVRCNACFTKINCISTSHRLNVFCRIFMKFYSLHVRKMKKKDTYDQDNCNILLPVSFKHPILQNLRFTDMKLRLYATDMNLNRKDENNT